MRKIGFLRLNHIESTIKPLKGLAELFVNKNVSIMSVGIASLAFGSFSGYAASLAPVTKIIAISGDAPSRGTGEFFEIETPVLNNNGEAAFVSVLRNNGFSVGRGVFRGNSNSRTADTIILQNDPTPDVNGNIGAINDPQLYINDHGQVALAISLTGTLGGPLDSSAIYRADGSAVGLFQIARANQSVPEGEGRFEIFLPPVLSMNSAGQVAFTARLRSTPGGQSDNQGIYRGDGTNITKIVRNGDNAPGVDGKFSGITSILSGPAINELGQVLFTSQLRLAPNQTTTDGIFRGDGTPPVKIVVQGDAAPNGNGEFGSLLFTKPAFNDNGEAAFATILTKTDLGTADNIGIFRGDGAKLVQIARRGDLAPGNNGRFLEFGSDVAIKNDGKVLFLASITGAANGAAGGIFIGDGNSITTVARLNDSAPEGGRFSEFSTSIVAFNSPGQVVFYASIDLENGGTKADSFGLFFYDPATGLHAVARKNDPLGDVGSITHIEFQGGLGSEGNENSGFNDQGQVAYKCFAGGDAAIALWELKDVGNNLPPTSAGLSVTANQGQILQLTTTNLLSVISDPEGGVVTLISVKERSAKGGTIRRTGNQINYTPQFNFLGEDEFEYVVQDEAGLKTTALVRVTVMEPNRAPIARSSGRGGFSINVEPKETLSITVSNLLGFVSDPDGDPITITLLSTTTMHGANLSREGDLINLQWDATTLQRAISSGGDQFEFKAEDGRGGSVVVQAEIVFGSNQNGLKSIQVSSTEVSFTVAAEAGTWSIERAPAVNGPWNEIGTVQIGPDRVRRSVPSRRPPPSQSAVFRDTNPPAGAAFYRVTNPSSK